MALPGISIALKNGQISQTLQTQDGIAGMILSGKAVSGGDKLALGTPYQLFNLQQAQDLGLSPKGSNAFAYEQIRKFYAEALTGAALWILIVAESTTMDAACKLENSYVSELQEAARGQIKLLAVSTKTVGKVVKSGDNKTKVTGLDPEVEKAVIEAQHLAEDYARKYHPMRVILDAKGFSGKAVALKDYKGDDKNRVCLFLCNDNASRNADVGTLLGRAASLPVQRNIGRVKNGPLQATQLYFTDGQRVEHHENDWGGIHDRAYIACRSYSGKAGYYFTDDPTLTSDQDDYNSLSRGRVVDKAIQLTYATYVEALLDEIAVQEDGTVDPALIKVWENEIENAVNAAMTASGEIQHFEAVIDAGQKVLENAKLEVCLRILPVACIRHIEVLLGFGTGSSDAAKGSGAKGEAAAKAKS